MVGLDIQQFAGGPKPLGKKRSQEQCQGHQDNVWMGTVSIFQLTGVKFSRLSQAYINAVSYGDSLMCSDFYF